MALALAATACAGTRSVSPEVREPSSAPTGVHTGDVFEVRVFGEPELSAEYRVQPDGSIDFPFLGAVAVAGLEPRDVAAAVADGLREQSILVDPQVTVFVKESNAMRVSVTGAVARPGTFNLVPGMTVVQAISMAGGMTALASQNAAVLTRREGTDVRRFDIPVRRISEGRESDVVVQGGDIIFVPERAF
ncbi:MAG: polysaccharide biosynthesis/export family protein [Myxococcota bacterium]